MKTLISTAFFLTMVVVASQAQDHRKMMNKVWNLIADKSYKMNREGKYEVYFPPELSRLNNKVVVLPGYMIPVKTGMIHQSFLLAVLPVSQCQYCGEGDVPSMVMVKMEKPLTYSDKPVTLSGTLNLNEKDTSQPELFLLNARLKEQ